jgi:hypothetical protein
MRCGGLARCRCAALRSLGRARLSGTLAVSLDRGQPAGRGQGRGSVRIGEVSLSVPVGGSHRRLRSSSSPTARQRICSACPAGAQGFSRNSCEVFSPYTRCPPIRVRRPPAGPASAPVVHHPSTAGATAVRRPRASAGAAAGPAGSEQRRLQPVPRGGSLPAGDQLVVAVAPTGRVEAVRGRGGEPRQRVLVGAVGAGPRQARSLLRLLDRHLFRLAAGEGAGDVVAAQVGEHSRLVTQQSRRPLPRRTGEPVANRPALPWRRARRAMRRSRGGSDRRSNRTGTRCAQGLRLTGPRAAGGEGYQRQAGHGRRQSGRGHRRRR